MRTISAIILIPLVAAVVAGIFPWHWWYAAAIAFVMTVIFLLQPKAGFGAGFFGVALFWGIAIVLQDMRNEHILSGRMAILFGLPGSFLFILVNILLGCIIGGLAGWCGGLMNNAFRLTRKQEVTD